MPDNWYVALFSMVIGIVVLMLRNPFAEAILDNNRRMRWHRPYRAERASVHTMVVAGGLGFIGSGVALLIGLQVGTFVIGLFVLTVLALLVVHLRAQ